MAHENFYNALRWVLLHEGGFSNHPADPGGATNKGVTQRVYDAFRKRSQLAPRSVREISTDEVQAIYRKQYWNVVRADELPSGLDYCVFDFAVNSGPGRAIQFMQRELGVAADGIIGEITLDAAERLSPLHIAEVCDNICTARLTWLKRLKHWPTFGRGWTRRVEDVRKRSTGLAESISIPPGAAHRDYLEGPPVDLTQPMGRGDGPARMTARAGDAKGPLASVAATVIGGMGSVVTALADAPAPLVYAAATVIVIGGVVAAFYFLREAR